MTEKTPLPDYAMDQLFRAARTYSGWRERPITNAVIQAIYDLMKWGATSANCQPARILFLTSNEAKEKLLPFLAEGNVEKTMTAPVTAIIAHDNTFYNNLPTQFPHADAKSWFVGDDALIADTAFRNASMQGGYFIMAARALGLDCGPMSGFDVAGVKATFFAENDAIHPNFLCNLGYGDDARLHPRLPRLEFQDVCEIL